MLPPNIGQLFMPINKTGVFAVFSSQYFHQSSVSVRLFYS